MQRQIQQQGYTILELMFAIALMAVIVSAIAAFTNSGFRMWQATRQQVDNQEKARVALRTIAREIRELKTADTGSFAIEAATATSLTFFANADADTGTERIRYFVENNELKRGVIEPTGTPVSYPSGNEVVTSQLSDVYPSGDVFSYFDQNYTGSEAPLSLPVDVQDIHLIQIHFVVDADPNTPPDGIDILTQIAPRNLKEYAPTP